MAQSPEPQKDIDEILAENLPSIIRGTGYAAYTGAVLLSVEAVVVYASEGFEAGTHPTLGAALFAGAGYALGKTADALRAKFGSSDN